MRAEVMMALGLGAGVAQAISSGIDQELAVTATGTTQADAYTLKTGVTVFSTVAASSGCVVPATNTAGDEFLVVNEGANALKVYPPLGGTVNGGATNISVSVPIGGAAIVKSQTATAFSALVAASPIESAYLDGLTPGTAQASKAVVLGANKDIDLINFGAIGANDASLDVTGLAAAQGGGITLTGGASSTSANAGGAVTVKGGAPGATGVGGAGAVVGGAGGATSGAGGAATVTGGAGTAGNAGGGSVVLTGGAPNGTGASGGVRVESLLVKKMSVAAKTVSVTLTAAEVLGGIITGLQGGAAAATYTLPLASSLDAALPADFGVGDAFEFSIVNLSTTAAETITIAGNTGVTATGGGKLLMEANTGTSPSSSGKFAVTKTGASTYQVYRMS